jgi:hypothetical protein
MHRSAARKRTAWSMWIRVTTAPVVATSNKEPNNNGDVTVNVAWDQRAGAANPFVVFSTPEVEP